MDILRKELDDIYKAQDLMSESLQADSLSDACKMADNLISITKGIAVITDASCDRCYVFSGPLGSLIGKDGVHAPYQEFNSSDEDAIYECMHPEDLVDKRFLEYEFFKFVDKCHCDDKTQYIAKCRIRMRDQDGDYRKVDNTTQVLTLSPAGKIWLILCTYSLSQQSQGDIEPAILNTRTGETVTFSFGSKRSQLLSAREKEVLRLIRDGNPSKLIADILGISIHTVNRHRQNILEKLSAANSVEAVTAATLMKLF